jgi:chemotaxis protein MotB
MAMTKTAKIFRKQSLAVGAGALSLLILTDCVSEKKYEQQTQQLQQTEAQVAAQQQQIAKMEEQDRWVVAGDLLFPSGGYQLTTKGKQALKQYLPRLQSLQNGKVVVYGYTDNKPVGGALQRRGIADNIDLSSKRADDVVAYFVSQGVNPNIISAKGFGDTHPIAPNDTKQGRRENRRIEIVVEGPGA